MGNSELRKPIREAVNKALLEATGDGGIPIGGIPQDVIATRVAFALHPDTPERQPLSRQELVTLTAAILSCRPGYDPARAAGDACEALNAIGRIMAERQS